MPDDAERAFGVARSHDMVAGMLEIDGDQLLDRRLVFYDQDIRGHWSEAIV
jgi:hypothetical protein